MSDPKFGDIYKWSADEFFVMFIAVREDGWTGSVLSGDDPDYKVGDTDEWVGQGVTLPTTASLLLANLHWEKVK